MLSCLRHLQPDRKTHRSRKSRRKLRRRTKMDPEIYNHLGKPCDGHFRKYRHRLRRRGQPAGSRAGSLRGKPSGLCGYLLLFQGFSEVPVCLCGKKSSGEIPLYGKWIARIRSVFIERDDPRASLEAINRGIEYIKEGFSLAIFPGRNPQ